MMTLFPLVLLFSILSRVSATDTLIPLTTSSDLSGLWWCGTGTSLDYGFGTYGASTISSLSIFGDAAVGDSAFVSETVSSTVFTASVSVYMEGECADTGLSIFPASGLDSFNWGTVSSRIVVRNNCRKFHTVSRRNEYSEPVDLVDGWYTWVIKYDGPGNSFIGEIYVGKDADLATATPLYTKAISETSPGESSDPTAVTFGSTAVRIGLFTDEDDTDSYNEFSNLRITSSLAGDAVPADCVSLVVVAATEAPSTAKKTKVKAKIVKTVLKKKAAAGKKSPGKQL